MAKALKTVGMIAGAVALVAGTIATAGIGSPAFVAMAGKVATYASLAAGVASIGAQALAKPPPVRGSVASLTILPDAPTPYVMGEGYFGGVLRHDTAYGPTLKKVPNPYRFMPIVYSGGGPVESIAPRVDFAPISSWYSGFLYTDVQLGACPEADALSPQWAGAPGWGSSAKLSGLAAIGWSLKFDKDGKRFASGVPLLGAEGRWARVYDPRLDSTFPGGSGPHRLGIESTYTWSANPALNAGTYAYGRYENGKRVLGMGLAPDAINWAVVAAWANVCDANGWTMFGVVYEPGDRWANLKDICFAGGAEPVPGAILSFRYSAPVVALDTITEDDLTNGDRSAVGMQSFRDRINTAVPKYRSAAHNWEMVDAAPVINPTFRAEDGEDKRDTWPFNFVTNPNQAAQLTAYRIFDSREIWPIALECKPRLRHYRPGECLHLDLPSLQLNTPVIILKREIDPVTMVVRLQLISETLAKHAYCLGKTSTPPPTPALGQTGEQRDEVSSTSLIGADGLPGTPGSDGQTLYTWIAYANDGSGSTGFTVGVNTGQTHIGIANNKTTATESTNPADYTWSLIRGTDGVPGTPGADGQTTYTWFAYASNASGTANFTTGAPNAVHTYIGLASNKATASESTNPADYTWSLIRGADGAPGTPGTPGTPGAQGPTGTVVTVYKRATSPGALPTTTSTYTFSSNSLANVNNGWSTDYPAVSGTLPLWCTQAVVLANTATVTIPASAWYPAFKRGGGIGNLDAMDFADDALWANKNVDNIADGGTYKRFSGVERGKLNGIAPFADVTANNAAIGDANRIRFPRFESGTTGWHVPYNSHNVATNLWQGIWAGKQYLRIKPAFSGNDQVMSVGSRNSPEFRFPVAAGERLAVFSGMEVQGYASTTWWLGLGFLDANGSVITLTGIDGGAGPVAYGTRRGGFITVPAGACFAWFEAYIYNNAGGASSSAYLLGIMEPIVCSAGAAQTAPPAFTDNSSGHFAAKGWNLTQPGSGQGLGDQRNMPAIAALNLGYKFTGAITYSATAGTPATATISVGAGQALIGSTTLNYNAMSVNVTGTGGTSATYYLYVQESANSAEWGGSKTLIATTIGDAVYNNDSNVLIGAVTVAFPSTGGSSGGGSSGGGGGGGLTCVDAESWMPDGRQAQDYGADDVIRVIDETTWQGATYTKVVANKIVLAAVVRLTSASGISVVVSENTPCTLLGGATVDAIDALGSRLAVESEDGFWWEEITSVERLGERLVAHLSAHDSTYAAGEEPGRFIYTHNAIAKP